MCSISVQRRDLWTIHGAEDPLLPPNSFLRALHFIIRPGSLCTIRNNKLLLSTSAVISCTIPYSTSQNRYSTATYRYLSEQLQKVSYFGCLGTSGHNSVGTGDWEYRLRPVVCHGIPDPPCAAWLAGGGGVCCCHSFLSHPPTRFKGRRPGGCRPPANRGLVSLSRLCLVHPSLVPNPFPYHVSGTLRPVELPWDLGPTVQ